LTSPVRFPEKPLVAVTIPDATTLVSVILSSRLTVTVLDAADDVKLVPPEIVKTSLSKLIFSEPESPETVKAVPTEAVPAAVKRPLESTVNVGIAVEDPYEPAATPVVESPRVTAAVSEPEPFTTISDEPASATVAT